ncbi:MauE/DoxX family redox-associated membrane protein [Plantactinospora sp. B6F1]|uniref:MauE/DoxX family redox-associated membrane protein n=1 Tax=Plantactinospora sp. B6F1 TaxID=3158971 RepID=UPI0032D95B56
MPYLAIGIRCLIGVVFLGSIVGKLTGRDAFEAFVASTARISALPDRFVRPLALGVVGAEAAVCVLVTVPSPAAVLGLVLAAGLLVAFAVGVLAAIVRGERTPCRCFGASTLPLGPSHVVRNIALALVAVLGATIGTAATPAQLPGGVLAALSAVVLGGVLTRLDDIVGLFRSPAQEAADVARGLILSHSRSRHALPDRSTGHHRSALRTEPDSHPRGDQTTA